ncbi:MAG: hypothetical protein SGILL_010087, partial [Bacillariaceae sp.]
GEKDKRVFTRSQVEDHVKAMVDRAKEGIPLTEDEIQDVVNGAQNLLPKNAPVDFEGLQGLLKEVAHLSHKNWGVTSTNSDKLLETLSISSAKSDEENDSYPLRPHARQFLERILTDGNWDGAVDAAKSRTTGQAPWAVLVTGVNGIRKTTSMYQPWFAELLSEALVPPKAGDDDDEGSANKKQKTEATSPQSLPTGTNSFFRQLDHMICTVCNEEFCRLYQWASSELPEHKVGEGMPSPAEEVIEKYSDYKAAIFSRYRTLSELLGALLLKQAQLVDINCMMETSGRDVAMFHYVDHFFGDTSNYNKLALHFTINDLTCAQQSVDRRMISEIQAGAKAIESGDAFDVVYTNEGGPYGSKVLAGVQKDSDKVWESEVMSGNVGKDWYKATIAINAHPTEPWTAQAVKPDGTLGTKFTFERK